VKQVRQFAMKRNIETSSAFADAVAAIGQGPLEPLPDLPELPAEGAQEPPTAQPERPPEAAPRAPERPPEAAPRALAAARDLLARCVLFPLYPTLLKRDLQLIVKVLSALP
jgi:hypothetical protein